MLSVVYKYMQYMYAYTYSIYTTYIAQFHLCVKMYVKFSDSTELRQRFLNI